MQKTDKYYSKEMNYLLACLFPSSKQDIKKMLYTEEAL